MGSGIFPKNNKKILVRGFIIHVSSNFRSLYILPAFGLNNEGIPVWQFFLKDVVVIFILSSLHLSFNFLIF